MNKALFGIFFILVFSLLLAGCAKENASADNGQQNIQDGETGKDNSNNPDILDNQDISDSSDTYVDEQIIDENESVEIGEMI